jgi:L-alanine-DL-glutamate epimerase and related enzymes of enolase superfamily
LSARIGRVEAHVYRYPVQTPVRTSFGTMRERPALFVRIEDDDGAEGWGEVWCNFPDVGAEHRARLLETVFASLLEGCEATDAAATSAELTRRTAVLAIQSGESGPIHQCIAGIDIALWDLAAKRARQPLWRMLGGHDPRIRVYASGINPESPERTALAARAAGYRAFKLKVGFGDDLDIANLRAMRSALGDEAELMVDANQGWDLDAARRMSQRMAEFELRWLEEPLRADRPWAEWQALAKSCAMPLAGGENLVGLESFDSALEAGALRVFQPDVAKWGGVSGCLEVARRAMKAGHRYCPHYLGAGIGLLASAHLLAAAGGDGMLEVDANPNPLRTLTCGPVAHVCDGWIELDGRTPGLGAAPDESALRPYRR